jgi:membrane protein DedA with SNARE-associated domain
MEKQIVDFLAAYVHPYGYIILFLVTVLEASAFVGIFVPGDTVVVLSGLLASRGLLKFPLVVVIAAAGAVIGDNIGYFIGRRYGLPFLIKYGRRLHLRERHLRRANEFFRKHGGKSVVLGRFATYIRAFIPVVAGISGMNYRVFLFYNFAGGVLWAAAIASFGYFFGHSWDQISRILGVAWTIILSLAVVGIITFLIVRRRRAALRRVSSGADSGSSEKEKSKRDG